MKQYDPKAIEPKWQKIWAESGIYKTTEDKSKPKRYVLEYFPYPSGAAMHVGHVRNYTIGDVVARYNRMQGFNVLHPMGWDGFGLPAENYAIENKISPRKAIDQNTSRFKQQLSQMGFSYDWSREIDSTDPAYYKWTQWLFLLLFKKGLAYQKESLQWWCPHDKTVLANEQVEAGKCWRCGHQVEKKALKQWFFKITTYADRLLKGLDNLDWSESIKAMQRNWIGRSVGAEVNFKVEKSKEVIKVFTTRADTLYGATFMVLAPEHPLVSTLTTKTQRLKVERYVKQTLARSDIERQETERPKTGVFTGSYAINPLSKAKIPIWVADYVLMGYGTGAIMAVPAHDQRDYEFAQKFKLPVTEVIEATTFDADNPPKAGKPNTKRDVAICVIKNKQGKYLTLKWNKLDWQNFVMGGVEKGEQLVEAAKREIAEETGYTDVEYKGRLPFAFNSIFYAAHKDVNRDIRVDILMFELKSAKKTQTKKDAHEDFELVWVNQDQLKNLHPVGGLEYIVKWVEQGDYVYTGEGRVINSGKYTHLGSQQVREQVVKDLAKKGVAKEKVNYKMRDWLISRQRYWGAPIPIIHCPKDGLVAAPQKDLPVELPELQHFEPSGDGRSPLASVPEFVKTTCPKCGGQAERETDTMDGFACSSWYFLRFADPHNTKEPFSKAKADFWLPVDDYIGGAEHAVMHLLYARFWTMVMHDEGLVKFEEPFTSLRNQGMILAPDGQKMSKSKHNTIEPDGLIKDGYGADAIRIMELFIGPWDQAANWSVEGMGGSHRFLGRVWQLVREYRRESERGAETGNVATLETELDIQTNRAVKKVTQELSNMSFNTAIATMMELVNAFYKLKVQLPFGASPETWKQSLETLTKLLAPFTPHISEELWQELGNQQSVHVQSWPEWDEQLTQDELVTVVVQVNGKVRANLSLAANAHTDEMTQAAQADPAVQSYLQGKKIVKTITVPSKLVNFVVK